MVQQWFLHPAKWWEFWYPMSGIRGGCLIAAAVYTLDFAVSKIAGY